MEKVKREKRHARAFAAVPKVERMCDADSEYRRELYRRRNCEKCGGGYRVLKRRAKD